jgi:hypothetical protein
MKIQINKNTMNISVGNIKMGNVHSVSVLPYFTCDPEAPCKKECYAGKIMRLRPAVQKTWEENTKTIMEENPQEIINGIVQYIKNNDVKLFRWNVGGDFRLNGYFEITLEVARRCPETLFLAFTKCYEKSIYRRTKNYSLVLSVWHNYMPTWKSAENAGLAYYDDGNPCFPIPTDAKECTGDCENCMACFNMKAGEKVYFKKH